LHFLISPAPASTTVLAAIPDINNLWAEWNAGAYF